MRNCLNQLITSPIVASAMFEYRFTGSGELAGHNLGNLMLKALDHLSVRPLEAINLICGLLKVDAVIVSPHTSVQSINDRLIVQQPLSAADVPRHHDRELLR